MNDQPNNQDNTDQPTAPQQPPAPQQPVAPPPVYQPVPPQPQTQYVMPMENPGQTLGIVGLVLNFIGISIGGIILGVMSRNKSRAANMSTTLGTVSLVWGIIATVIGFIGFILFLFLVIISSASSY